MLARREMIKYGWVSERKYESRGLLTGLFWVRSCHHGRLGFNFMEWNNHGRNWNCQQNAPGRAAQSGIALNPYRDRELWMAFVCPPVWRGWKGRSWKFPLSPFCSITTRKSIRVFLARVSAHDCLPPLDGFLKQGRVFFGLFGGVPYTTVRGAEGAAKNRYVNVGWRYWLSVCVWIKLKCNLLGVEEANEMNVWAWSLWGFCIQFI